MPAIIKGNVLEVLQNLSYPDTVSDIEFVNTDDSLQEKIDFLELENRALKAEIKELKEILAIEMERSHIRTELKTNRLLKKIK